MDWANEDYVKVYRRETDDDILLSWQAMALWRAMLPRFDRSGVLETKRGVRGLAAIARIPLEVVEPAIEELLGDGRVVRSDTGYFAPNFLEAQETSKSDRVRQRESRMRRAESARSGAKTAQSVAKSVVETTSCHVSSRAVTAGHAESQVVTLSSADPDPQPEQSEPPSAPTPPPVQAPDLAALRARGMLAEAFWAQVSAARVAEAEKLRIAGVLPFPKLNPGHQPKAFDELRQRIREEGDNAAAVCEYVLARLTEQARADRTVEWLSEKVFLEGPWRTARERVPGAQRAPPRDRQSGSRPPERPNPMRPIT